MLLLSIDKNTISRMFISMVVVALISKMTSNYFRVVNIRTLLDNIKIDQQYNAKYRNAKLV